MISGTLCPRDTLALTAFRAPGGQHVDRCGHCEGLWLPAEVVSSIIGHRPDTSRVSSVAGKPSFTRLCCPDDGSAMLALHLRGAEIDICSRCGGVWLDRGELEQILEAHRDEDDEFDLGDAAETGIDVVDSLVERVGARGLSSKPVPMPPMDQQQTQLLLQMELQPVEASVSHSAPSSAAFDGLVEAASPTEIASSGGDALQAIFDFVGEALSGL